LSRLGNLKQTTEDKILDIADRMDMQARSQYIGKIMKEDGVTYEEAIAMCSPGGDPKYTLGWKMCSPKWIVAFKTSKKSFEKFIRVENLTPEEEEIFRMEVMPTVSRRIKKEMKKQKRDKNVE